MIAKGLSRGMKSGTCGSRGLKFCFSAIRELAAAFVCVAGLLLPGPTPASSADITIRQAWSRATPEGASVAAGYLTIENRGNTVDRLLSVSSPVARKVEIHETLEAGGIMRMRPAKDGLAIPPHGKLVLAQGGSHLMFLQLMAPFSEGGRVPVSLDFERAGQIDTSLEVGEVGAKGPPSVAASEAFAGSASGSDSFFTHIHDPRVKANVTLSPGRSGPVEVVVQRGPPGKCAGGGRSVGLVIQSRQQDCPERSSSRADCDRHLASTVVCIRGGQMGSYSSDRYDAERQDRDQSSNPGRMNARIG
jgi:copper(I)-binding protein